MKITGQLDKFIWEQMHEREKLVSGQKSRGKRVLSRMSEPVNRESWDAALSAKKPLSPVKKEHKT